MGEKYKISEFANILGITPKTVYRMIEREELMTVNEKVNNRLITLVIATDEEVQRFKNNYGKNTDNIGNCEDILTDNNELMNFNNSSNSQNTNLSASDVLDKIVSINEEYNNRLMSLNEELINSKSKMLYLEDKASREGLYIQEINELKNDNKQLMKSKQLTFNLSITVISMLIIVIIYLTLSFKLAEQKNANFEKIKNEKIENIKN